MTQELNLQQREFIMYKKIFTSIVIALIISAYAGDFTASPTTTIKELKQQVSTTRIQRYL